MKRALLTAGAIFAIVFPSACRSRIETAAANRATLKSMPKWYASPPKGDDKWIYSPATATSQDVQIAINKAQAEGRAGLASQLEVKYGALTRRFAEETGTGMGAQLLSEYEQTYKAVVSQVLIGTRAKDQKFSVEAGVYRAWVLMELPVGEASKKLLEQLRQQEQLYTRIQATNAYKELNEEVEKYEAARRR
ncbi:MAG TPA: hypothetical protein VE967_00625 [Gemmatimonadaceae bacterium]|nr:hypothetical protein [Gemmatimonadaceae bacterium]